MDNIIYTRQEDGGVSVVVPASKKDLELILGPLTDVQYEEYVWNRSVPKDAVSACFVDNDKTPDSREFRDEWKQNGDSIVVDMPLARIKHMDRIREMRKKKFEDMGFPMQLNPQIESAILDDTTKAELKRLRDIPDNFDLSSASTTKELKVLWPEGIDKHPVYK